MIDALLYAVRDGIREANIGYGYAECEIMDDGRPPPRAGKIFVSIHGGHARPGPANDRNLDQLFGFSLTFTMRVIAPLDRVGDQQIARGGTAMTLELARKSGFNAKLEQLKGLLHLNWGIVVLRNQTPNSANDNLAAWCTGTIYGFAEPVRWTGGDDIPRLVGGEWFGAEPPANDGTDEVGIVAEMQFDGARRIQPQTAPQGPFV